MPKNIISRGQANQLIDRLEDAGLLPKDAQSVIESEGNKVAKKIVTLIRHDEESPFTSRQLARSILPKGHFFGFEEWEKYFGGKVRLAMIDVARIYNVPWSEREIRKPGLDQEHFLFLGMDMLGGESLNLRGWNNFCQHPAQPQLNIHIGNNASTRITGGFRWYMMPVGIVEGSLGASYEDQLAALPKTYRVPSAIERVTANILFYLLNGRCLDDSLWVRVHNEFDDTSCFVIRGKSDSITVDNWHNDAGTKNLGLAACRKILNRNSKS